MESLPQDQKEEEKNPDQTSADTQILEVNSEAQPIDEEWQWIYHDDTESADLQIWFVSKDPSKFEWSLMEQGCQQELEERYKEDPSMWMDITLGELKFWINLGEKTGHVGAKSKSKPSIYFKRQE